MTERNVNRTAVTSSAEPWEPAPDECLPGQPWPMSQRCGWESLIPTPEDCARVLGNLIDNHEALRQIGLMRRFLRANRGESPPRAHPFYELAVVGRRWAGEPISRGILAALKFEGYGVEFARLEPDFAVLGGTKICWLSLTPELHAELSAVTQTVLAQMDGALANVPGHEPSVCDEWTQAEARSQWREGMKDWIARWLVRQRAQEGPTPPTAARARAFSGGPAQGTEQSR